MFYNCPVLSICTSCRDGREAVDGSRGGTRLAQAVITQLSARSATKLKLRGLQCMSQGKRPCIASLSGHDRFTYVFGDIDPENPDYFDALSELVARYKTTPEGFLKKIRTSRSIEVQYTGPLASTEEWLVACYAFGQRTAV